MAEYDIPGLKNQIIQQAPSGIETGGASSGTGTGGTTGTAPTNWGITASKSGDPEIFIFNAIVIFLYVLSIISVLTFVWAGVRYITSAGDAEKAESAKKIITGSIIGILIILGSLIFFNFGVDMFKQPNKTVEERMDTQYKAVPLTP